MDMSYSGMRDAVFDILRQTGVGFPEEATGKIVDEYVLPLLAFVLESLDKTREDLDTAIERKLDEAGA